MLKIIRSEEFFKTLCQIDMDIFISTKQNPCPHCQGKLDQANYLRKPRGVVHGPDKRFSLCCREEGCRKRLTTPSVRFIKGFTYHSIIVLLAAYFMSPSNIRLARLCRIFKVDRRTMIRWRQFWSEIFPKTKLHKTLKGFIPTDEPLVKAIFSKGLGMNQILQLFKDSSQLL